MARVVVEQEHAPPADRVTAARQEDGLWAKHADDHLQRQPEAAKPHDEEEEKKLHAKRDAAGGSRSAGLSPAP